MKEQVNNKIRFWFELVLSVLSAAVAILFITEVADIYYAGKAAGAQTIFTPAVVWSKLQILLAPLILWLHSVIACFVISVAFPLEQKKHVPGAGDRVRKLRNKMPRGSSEEFKAAHRSYMKYETGRYVMYGVATAFAVATAIIAIVYLADKTHFTDNSLDISEDILMLVKHVFPFIVGSFVLFVAAVLYEHFTAKAELAQMTKMLVSGKGGPVMNRWIVWRALGRVEHGVQKAFDKTAVVWAVRGVIFTLAVVFIGLGAANGGAGDVLYKAVNICTECIGLG